MAIPASAETQTPERPQHGQTWLAGLLTAAARPLPMSVRRAALFRLQRLQSWIISLDPETKARQEVARNLLTTAFGDSGRQVDTVLSNNLRCEDRRVADQVAAAAWPAEGGKWFAIPDGDPLASARKAETGSIVALFHIGPHVLVPPLLVREGFEVHVIVLKESADFWRANWLEPAERERIHFIEAESRASIRRAVSALSAGGAVVVYCDIVTGSIRSKHQVKFLGIDAWLPLGAAVLAALSGARIYPVVPDEQSDGTYVVRTLEVIVPPPSRERSAIVDSSQKLLAVFARYVSDRPESWLSWQSPEEFFVDGSVATERPVPANAPGGSPGRSTTS